MRTHSHFLITAFIWDALRRCRPPIHSGRAFLLGSIVPDVPLMILTLWYLIHRIKSENPPSHQNPLYGPEYDDYYFNNDWWKLSLSLFHAPFLIVFYLFLGAAAWSLSYSWGSSVMWFSTSCGLHACLDLVTQVEDGLLIVFPFNWHYRFESWVSYYDPAHGGHLFTLFEFVLDTLLIFYFIYRGVESSLSHKRMENCIEVSAYADGDQMA